MPSGMIRQTFG